MPCGGPPVRRNRASRGAAPRLMTGIFIISAPSGTGKSTLLKKLIETDGRLLFSVSYTTRAPRGAEKQGESYHYISREEFEARIARDEFIEWAEVFGNYYGTHRGYLDRATAEDRDLVLDIDVQGARQLMERVPDAVSIFILAPSPQTLEERLRKRAEDPEEVIQRRLRQAAEEISQYRHYDYVVVNDDAAVAAGRLAAILKAERSRSKRMEGRIRPILDSFGAISR
jgi:guanylate kinase